MLIFLHLPLPIWLSVVLAGLLSLTVACPSCKSVCQNSLETTFLVIDLGMESCDTGSAPGHRWKNTVPGCSLVPVSLWLLAGPSWSRYLSRSDVLTCALRCASTPERPTLSQCDLCTESCGTGSAPGIDGNRKASKFLEILN